MTRGMLLLSLVVALAVVAAACGNGDGDAVGDADIDPPTDEGADGDEDTADDAEDAADPEDAVEITIIENAVRGGKSANTADWLVEDAIPAFEDQMAEEGTPVTVELVETGADDEDYKTQLALDLSVGEGADIMGFDEFWTSEFVAAGYLEPLSTVVGSEADEWDGWDDMPDAVAESFEVDGDRYGIPFGTDGRVLYFRQDLFEDAGLDPEWEPTDWEDILDTARTINEELPDVVPLQMNAGTQMGEATTMQGFLPLLLGTGDPLYDDGWLGDSQELRDVLEFYQTVYVDEGLGDPDLQVRADGRDQSFEMFSNGELAILGEGDYFWRAVVGTEDEGGLFPMEDRDELVGWAMIPSQEPGAGVNGQDFVSASGGNGRVLNPNTEHPEEAWAFMAYLGSEAAVTDFVEREPRITARLDVNEFAIGDDPMLSDISDEILPITWYRPGFEEYPQISELLQLATENVVSGREDVDTAVEGYLRGLEGIVDSDEIR